MNLPTIAIPRPTLPSPLPTDWQAICDVFYDHFQSLCRQVRDNNAALHPGADDVYVAPDVPGMMRSPHQDEIAAVMPAKVNAAVVLANLNYQVGNGGFAQYHDNGYSAALPTAIQLLSGAKALGVRQADEALAIVEEFGSRVKEAEFAESAYRGYGGRYGDDECEEDDGPSDPYGDLDGRWYALETETLGQAVLDRFQDILEASFRPTLRRAA